jgi:hypothetical protein
VSAILRVDQPSFGSIPDHAKFLAGLAFENLFAGIALDDDPIMLAVDHFFRPLRVYFLDSTALIVRFNFRATRALSIFKASNAKSCASSARVQGRPVGRGPSLIFPSPSAQIEQAGIENSANQVDGNSLSVALSKRFSAPRASGK